MQTCNKGAASGEETGSNLPAVPTAMLRTTVHTTVAAAAGETTITKKNCGSPLFLRTCATLLVPAPTSPLLINSFFFGVCIHLNAEVVSIWIFILVVSYGKVDLYGF